MVTMARSTGLTGLYTPHPANPVLTNANTSSYFQTVGHADLFQDATGHWWAVALATRSGPAYIHYPMGRETVLTPVAWEAGEGTASNNSSGWPHFASVQGHMQGPLPPAVDGDDAGCCFDELAGDDIDFGAFSRRSSRGTATLGLPPHFTFWRPPVADRYSVSVGADSNTTALHLLPSAMNLTGLNGNYAGPGGLTFVGRRQQHTLFAFRAALTYRPTAPEEEAGVTVFLTQNHHLDLGVVRLQTGTKNGTRAGTGNGTASAQTHLRFRGITSGAATARLPADVVVPVPASWYAGDSGRAHTVATPPTLELTLQIQAANATHYTFAAWPTRRPSQMLVVAQASNTAVSFGFTGTLLGVYCTSSGGEGTAALHVHRWEYEPQGQFYA